MTNDTTTNTNPANPEKQQDNTHINSLPMAWFRFTARGKLGSGHSILVKGRVGARRGLYYQAQALAIESILKDIPSFILDDDSPIGLTMLKRVY